MTVTKEYSIWDFKNMFTGSQYEHNFTEEQFDLLYDVIDEIEDSKGINPYNSDLVAICCDYSGYTEEELISDYGYLMDKEEFDIEELEEVLEERTELHKDGVGNYIIRNF